MNLQSPALSFFLVFCRVGGCLMTAPGFSSDRVPVQFRLYLAAGVTAAVAPSLLGANPTSLNSMSFSQFLTSILAELTFGTALGLLSRYYFFALETLATALAMTFGVGNIFGAAVAEQDPAPSLSSFVSLAALVLVFCADLHLELIRALCMSYDAAPLFAFPGSGAFLEEITHILTQAHILALRICSPFLMFGLVVNISLGLLARLSPQLQIYFISGPLVIFLGVGALFVLGWDFYTGYVSHYRVWLIRG